MNVSSTGRVTPEELLAAADQLLTSPVPGAGAQWPRACALLMRRSLSHKEIAEQLGFSSAFHFSNAFKKYFWMSPSQFRVSRKSHVKNSRHDRL